MTECSAQEFLRLRLLSHRLIRHDFKHPDEVVAWLGAIQAQDYAGAKWSIGLRLPGATDDDIERAIAERTIVRTSALRGTLHFIAAADVRWMLKLLAPRIFAGFAGVYRTLQLDDSVFARSANVLMTALQGGNRLSRRELQAILGDNGIPADGNRGNHLFYRAALDGVICHGPRRGKEFTYVLLDEWLPDTGGLPEGDEAMRELARRYFISHGPATAQDFAWWAGQTVTRAGAALELCKSHLSPLSFGGRTYWMANDQPETADAVESTWLLPGFDEYLVGYKDRDAVLPADYWKLQTGNGILTPVVVVNGHGEGTWKRTLKTDSVAVKITPFSQAAAIQDCAAAMGIERFRAFIG